MFRAVSIVVAGLFATALAAQSCYDTSLIESNALGVCNPSAAVSQCCPWGQICYSNGLCHNPNDTAIVGTTYTLFLAYGCTDRTSNSGLCEAWARCKNTSATGGGGGLTDCKNNKWCCYGTKGCSCSDPSAVFTLSPADIVTSLPATKPTPTSSIQLSSTLTTSVLATSVVSPNSAVFSGGTTTSATAAAQSSTDSGGTSNAAAIGGGVGAGVGVALVVAIVAVIFCMRRRRKTAVPPAELDNSTGRDGYAAYSSAPKYAPVVYAHEAPASETRELPVHSPIPEQKGNGRAELY